MAIYDPGDCVYNPNVINGNDKQILGDVIIMLPKGGAIGTGLTTVRTYGASATGIYQKYHKRNHTDWFTIDVNA